MDKLTQQVHAVDFLDQLPTRIKYNSMMMDVLRSVVPSNNQVINQDGSFHSAATFVDYFTNKDLLLVGNEPLPPDAVLPEKRKSVVMAPSHLHCLHAFYKPRYGNRFKVIKQGEPRGFCAAVVEDTILKFQKLTLLGQQFHCLESPNPRGAYIQVIKENGLFQIGKILYFFIHVLYVPGRLLGEYDPAQHVFAFVKWYKEQRTEFHSFDDFLSKIWRERCLPDGAHSILPVN